MSLFMRMLVRVCDLPVIFAYKAERAGHILG